MKIAALQNFILFPCLCLYLLFFAHATPKYQENVKEGRHFYS